VKRAAALLLACAAACGSDPPPPSLLLVTIDTLRADAVSAETAPRLWALAAAGTRFTHATTVTPLTLPAHASMLTGLRPGRHGLTINGAVAPLPVDTLTQTLAARGWRTAAFVSAKVLDARLGLAPGFERYDDELLVPGGPPDPQERRADRTVDAALAWDGWQAPAFFAWVHLFDPHAPYAAPGGATGSDRAAYLDEVRYADAQLGRLLDGVVARARGEVLVVVVSDHGEGLGEHGEETHGLLLHEATLHVPLVVTWLRGGAGRPFAQPGEVRADAVSVMDLAPTLAELLGLPAPAGTDGASVVQPRPGRALPLETRAPWFYYGFSPLVGVRRDEVKLIGAPESLPPGWTRYDLAADPGELSGTPADGDPLQALVRSPHPPHEAEPLLDEAALRALGYAGARAPAQTEAPRDDPRARLDLIVALDRANTDLVEGRPEAALARLLAAGPPDAPVPELLFQRGRALRALQRHDEAVEQLQRACALQPSPELLGELGLTLLARAEARGGDGSDAAVVLDTALGLAPGDPHLIALRGLADLQAGNATAALQRVLGPLRERPRDVELLTVQVRALRALQRAAEAEHAAKALREAFPASPDWR
jgi:choline-sulfatase